MQYYAHGSLFDLLSKARKGESSSAAKCVFPVVAVPHALLKPSPFSIRACVHHAFVPFAGKAKAVKELAWGKRLEMMKDVAAGMAYLHR